MRFSEQASVSDLDTVDHQQAKATGEALGQFLVRCIRTREIQPEALDLKTSAVQKGHVPIELSSPFVRHG